MIGTGRAGWARLSAIEASSGLELAAKLSRESARTLNELLADATLDAVVICTPNQLHHAQVESSLRAGKHVCVEFPLTSGPEPARQLFELARQRGRVLHVEHIELLSSSQLSQRERVADLGRPTGGALEFTAARSGWIGDASLAGSIPLRALARLHRLVDLFGPGRVAGASLEAPEGESGDYRLSLSLEFDAGGNTTLVERRGAGLARATRWHVSCERGVLSDPEAAPAAGLFAADLAVFEARIRGTGEAYVSEARVIEVLELVAQAEALLAAS